MDVEHFGSWAEAATLLGIDRARGCCTAEVVAQRISDPDQYWAAVRSVLDALLGYACDFRALECSLAAFDEVPRAVWTQLSHRHHLLATPQRARHAAAWSWAMHTAAEWTDAPAAIRCWPGHIRQESRREGYRRFASGAPPGLKADVLSWTRTQFELPSLTGSSIDHGVWPERHL